MADSSTHNTRRDRSILKITDQLESTQHTRTGALALAGTHTHLSLIVVISSQSRRLSQQSAYVLYTLLYYMLYKHEEEYKCLQALIVSFYINNKLEFSTLPITSISPISLLVISISVTIGWYVLHLLTDNFIQEYPLYKCSIYTALINATFPKCP